MSRRCAAAQWDQFRPGVHGSLSANERSISRSAVGIIATRHIGLDIAETVLSKMGFECCECLMGCHVWNQSHINLCHHARRKNSFPTWSVISPNQSLVIYSTPSH